MRIVAGTHEGRHLVSPQDQRVRPTSERTRSGIFDLLGEVVKGARVLDLFAGTGALGLEAMSRGAVAADFVEFKPDSLHALRANVAALRLQESTRIFKKDAVPFMETLRENAYDIAFADPPYGSKLVERTLEAWKKLKFSRVLVLEHAKSHDVPKGSARRSFDDTTVTVYRP